MSGLLLLSVLQATPAVTAVVSPETVRVGEPFLLGVSVRIDPGAEVLFPPAVPAQEELEQAAGAEISRSDSTPGQWRAYYRLVAWRVGATALPPLTLRLVGSGGEREIEVASPSIAVVSVLPADTAGLELRDPRPPLPQRRFPWLAILLALLALLLVLWWLRRRAGRRDHAAAKLDPADAALRAFAALRADLESGRTDGTVGYDRLEAILREYLAATRAWRPGSPLRSLAGATDRKAPSRPDGRGPAGPSGGGRPAAPERGVRGTFVGGDGDGRLAGPLRRSALARFARLGVDGRAALTDADVCAKWVRNDHDLSTRGEGGG
ncbi:MAG: hypothetical protein ACE5JR_04725 [Gemmatimonadota bacterium]